MKHLIFDAILSDTTQKPSSGTKKAMTNVFVAGPPCGTGGVQIKCWMLKTFMRCRKMMDRCTNYDENNARFL